MPHSPFIEAKLAAAKAVQLATAARQAAIVAQQAEVASARGWEAVPDGAGVDNPERLRAALLERYAEMMSKAWMSAKEEGKTAAVAAADAAAAAAAAATAASEAAAEKSAAAAGAAVDATAAAGADGPEAALAGNPKTAVLLVTNVPRAGSLGLGYVRGRVDMARRALSALQHNRLLKGAEG